MVKETRIHHVARQRVFDDRKGETGGGELSSVVFFSAVSGTYRIFLDPGIMSGNDLKETQLIICHVHSSSLF